MKGLEEYFLAKNFYGIILVLDRIYLGNSPAFKEIILKILNKRGIKLNFDFQIMEVQEFEDLIEPFKNGMSWKDLIERKLQPDVKENPFKAFDVITVDYSTSDNKLLIDRFNMFIEAISNAIYKIELPSKYPILSMFSN